MPTLLSINNYHYYRGGAETVFLEHNRMFEAQAWNVIPFAMKHRNNLETPWSKYFVDEIEFGGQYTLSQKLSRTAKVIYSLEARRKLARLIDTVHPDVCHAHNIYHHISPSILGLLRDRGIPTVMTLHDLKIACPEYHMLAHDGVCERCKGGHLYNVLLNKCIKGSVALSAVVMVESMLHRLLGSYRDCVGRFIVPSQFYIDKFVEWGMPRSQFKHVANFVDVNQFRPAFEPGEAYLYLGRLSREKGLTTLVRAAAIAKCPLWIAGTGMQENELRKLAVDLGADVTFLGYLTGEDLRNAVRGSRAVILPSEWYENAPISILEAYALGKPVIGANIGGIPELIRNAETGLTFKSGDEQSLAAALRAMMDRSDMDIEQMGRVCRRWVESDFTAEIYQQHILETYREVGVDVSVRMPVASGA